MIDKRVVYIASLGLLGSLIYAFNFKLHGILLKRGFLGPGIELRSFFLYQYVALGILYLVGIIIVFRHGRFKTNSPVLLYIILFFGLIYRLFLLPPQPMLSSDMYRYIWDGRVQSHGINPYRYPPNHEALEKLRDDAIYPNINRKGSPTIYPAGAQVLFYLINRIGVRSVVAFKGVTTLFDMGSILLLVMILTNIGLHRERVLVYAWNPLVIYELANNGHMDGFVVFFFLLSLWFLVRERPNAAVSILAVAASLKLYPLIILPAILKTKRFRRLLLFIGIFFLLYVPYLSAGRKVLGFLPEYLTNPHETFNLGLSAYLVKFFPVLDHVFITKLFAVALIIAAGVVWIKKKRDSIDSIRFAYVLVGLQLALTSASLHPWYVLWIIPFLCLFPSPAWLYLSLLVPFSYLKYESPQGIFPEWVRHIEYIPFFILIAMEFIAFQWSSRVRFPLRLKGERASENLQEVPAQ